MKKRIFSIILATALVLTMVLTPAVLAENENNEDGYIECHGMVLPEVVNFNIRDWANPDTFRIIVDAIGYDGLGWCADAGTRIESGATTFFDGNVYISLCLDDAPDCVTERPWGSINWILNNWRGFYSSGDAQVAMWSLIHDYDFGEFFNDTGRTDFWGITWNQDNVYQLVADADPDFIPEPGDLVAVVLLVGNLCPGYEVTGVPPFVVDRSPAKQMVFIELERPEPEEELAVSKTAVTYFTRTYLWDIDKEVVTENGNTTMIEYVEYPKIWLYQDGSGDETATWNVCVIYDGYRQSGFRVSGNITIYNSGDVAANITGVVDELCGEEIDIVWVDEDGAPLDPQPGFPYILEPGNSLVGTYSEDGYCEGDNVVTVTTTRDVYTEGAPVLWGEPDEEINKVVNIWDNSDLFGLEHLGTLTAPNGGCFNYTKPFAWTDYTSPGPYVYDNTATIVETGQNASAKLVVNWEEPDDFAGCTPGYWKNNADKWDAVSWIPTGYSPDDLFSDVFGRTITVRAGGRNTIEDPTLLEALGATGGGINALARHAVAALLNAAHPDVNYPVNFAHVIGATQAAIDSGDYNVQKDEFEMWNELGCSIDMHGNPIVM